MENYHAIYASKRRGDACMSRRPRMLWCLPGIASHVVSQSANVIENYHVLTCETSKRSCIYLEDGVVARPEGPLNDGGGGGEGGGTPSCRIFWRPASGEETADDRGGAANQRGKCGQEAQRRRLSCERRPRWRVPNSAEVSTVSRCLGPALTMLMRGNAFSSAAVLCKRGVPWPVEGNSYDESLYHCEKW